MDSVEAILLQNGFTRQPSPLGSALVVVEDVAALSDDVDMCLRLLGGIAASPEVVNGFRCGPTVAYLPATTVAREVWVSDGFKNAHADLAAVFLHIVRMEISKWVALGSCEEFELSKTIANRRRCNHKALALATQAEHDAIKGVQPAWFSHHVFTLKGLLDFVTRPGKANWRDGL